MKVDSKDIDIVNRWNDPGEQRRKKISQPMKQHYAQINVLLAPFKRYTQAM